MLFTHTIVLQQVDANSYPLTNTAIPVKLKLCKKKDKITIQFPDVNFQTQSIFSPNNPFQNNLVQGGSLSTLSNPLPHKFRPMINQTFALSNNDIFLQAFSDASPIPVILSTFNVEINTRGEIRVLGSGSYRGIIPTGGHTLNAQTVSYFSQKSASSLSVKGERLTLSEAFTDVTQFSNDIALNIGFRDSHVNDNYDGLIAVTWTSNSDVTDKTQPFMDIFVRCGRYDAHGKCLSMGQAQNLTQFSQGSNPLSLPFVAAGFTYCWDTAISIVRKSSNVLVASSGLINVNANVGIPCYFTSVNGGNNWTGPFLLDPVTYPLTGTGDFSDCRGVLADPYGNVLYSTSLAQGNGNVDARFYFSGDGGNTWSFVYTTTDGAAGLGSYDYPQITAGNNGAGQTGFWFSSDFYTVSSEYADIVRHLGFLPVVGNSCGPFVAASYGMPGDGIMQTYPNQINDLLLSPITCDPLGNVYIGSWFVHYSIPSYSPVVLSIKNAPDGADVTDPLDPSLLQYATTIQNINSFAFSDLSISYPGFGYVGLGTQGILYDNLRQSLYCLFMDVDSVNSQNYYQYLKISFDQGATWSESFLLPEQHCGNRGYGSMALDPILGSMIVSWYDTEKSPSKTTAQYLGFFLSKKQLDGLVCKARKNF